MLPWIILLLLIAILLTIGVELLIKRLGIVPPEEPSNGLRDVLSAWWRWLERRGL